MELQPFLPPLQRPGLAVHQDAVGGGSALEDEQLDGTGFREPEYLEVEALDPLVAVHRMPVGHVAAVVRADAANVEGECVGLVDVSTGNSSGIAGGRCQAYWPRYLCWLGVENCRLDLDYRPRWRLCSRRCGVRWVGGGSVAGLVQGRTGDVATLLFECCQFFLVIIFDANNLGLGIGKRVEVYRADLRRG